MLHRSRHGQSMRRRVVAWAPHISFRHLAVMSLGLLLGACGPTAPKAPAPIAVTVLRVVPHAVSIPEEYPAELEAANMVEIRPRISGILERQEGIEGQPVKSGQVLFVIDQQPYQAALVQAQAALAQAEAAKAEADRDLERARPLSQIDALSLRELDAAVAQGAATAAQVHAAEAGVKAAQLNLGYTLVRAPIDGTMSRAVVRIGGVVTAYNTLVTTIYQMDPVYVNFSISEQRLLQLQRELGRAPNQNNPSKRTFRVLLADGEELATPAALNFLDAAVDARTDTLPIRLTIANPNLLLRSGQYVKVVVEGAARADAIVIPQRAVQELQNKRYVWIVDTAGKAQRRDVVMGARVGPDWLVDQGLNGGDTVITDGVQKLHPGAAVSATRAPDQGPQTS
jgi:membrane fusion protein, multidrug efflux system